MRDQEFSPPAGRLTLSPRPRAAILAALLLLSARGLGALQKPRLVSDFPLYELEYEGSYDLGDLLLARRPSAARAEEAFACSCFAASYPEGGRLLGRNFDWRASPVLALTTRPREGYASISLVDLSYLGYGSANDPVERPDALDGAWRIPFDGMNERGLAVAQMSVPRAFGGSGAQRPLVGSLGIIRILLDRAADVGEALAILGDYDVSFEEVPIHYILADASGDAAIVEYLDGRPRVLRGGELWAVSTNFILSETPPEDRPRQCRRYAWASAILESSSGVLADELSAFRLLSELSQPSTRWSAIYDLGRRRLALALGRDYATFYRFALADRGVPR